MKKIKVFSILECSDKNEGRGRMEDTGVYFDNELDAKSFISSAHYKKYAVMGVIPNGQYISTYYKEKTIIIYDSLKDFRENDSALVKLRLIESAKSKLSKEERQALGID
jgi:hypothetical protein